MFFFFFMFIYLFFFFFFFNDTATTEIYTLSLHDALPIWPRALTSTNRRPSSPRKRESYSSSRPSFPTRPDRKSTRLNSSHMSISYAVFCLKKKKKHYISLIMLTKKKKI